MHKTHDAAGNLTSIKVADPPISMGTALPKPKIVSGSMSPTDPRPNDGNVYPAGNPLGVDLSTLADLSQETRGKAIKELEALAEARALGNKQAELLAAAALAAIIGSIQDQKAVANVNKVFGALLHPTLGRKHGAVL